jgi:Fe-S cluster biogenesis protein NfuA
MEAVSILLEFTPNPNTLKFLVNRTFLERGAANFKTKEEAQLSPLATQLFNVPGVQGVMVGTQFVTITKSNEGNWDVVAEEVPKTIESFLATGAPAVSPEWKPVTSQSNLGAGQLAEVENKIREILDNEIRPAVAMDGGDIMFDRFEDGVVYLHLQGSCSSCPSSTATLKMGVESRLKDAIPEIKEVVQV